MIGLVSVLLGRNKISFIISLIIIIVDSSNTDLNSAWMAMGLRSVFDESTITLVA